MWKFIRYNNLAYDKVESILAEYEKNGYMVEKVKFRHFFKFKTKKKDNIGKYLFVYHHPRRFEILESEQIIKEKFRANEIKTDIFEPKIYRTTEDTSNLTKVKINIKKYHKVCAIEKIIISSFFLILLSLGVIINSIQNGSFEISKSILFSIFFTLVFFLILTNMIKNIMISLKLHSMIIKQVKIGDGSLSCNQISQNDK